MIYIKRTRKDDTSVVCWKEVEDGFVVIYRENIDFQPIKATWEGIENTKRYDPNDVYEVMTESEMMLELL